MVELRVMDDPRIATSPISPLPRLHNRRLIT